jgi:pyruvate kinase
MNFSHGSYEYHQSVIDNAREAEKTQAGRPVAIALDTVRSFRAIMTEELR